MKKTFLIHLAIALAIMVLGLFPLMGLPGALLNALAEPVVRLLKPAVSGEILPPDSAWPAAIITTLIWPPALPLLALLTRLVPAGWSGLARTGLIAAGLYLWAVAILYALVSLGPEKG